MPSVDTGGSAVPSGEVEIVVNPEPVARTGGVSFDRAWITARLDDGVLSVAVSGSASYDGRTAGTQIDVSEAAGDTELAAILQQLLDAHLEAITDDTLEAAYEARAINKRRARLQVEGNE